MLLICVQVVREGSGAHLRKQMKAASVHQRPFCMDEQATQEQEGKPGGVNRKGPNAAARTESVISRQNKQTKPENICPGKYPARLLSTGAKPRAEGIASPPCPSSHAPPSALPKYFHSIYAIFSLAPGQTSFPECELHFTLQQQKASS